MSPTNPVFLSLLDLLMFYSNNMKTQVELRFSEYYEQWVSQLDDYARQLLLASKEAAAADDGAHLALVAKLTTHHKDYYTAKWAAARQDVLAFYSPVWLTPVENAYAWMTGWKPSTVFRLVSRLGWTLAEEQLKKIEELRVKMRFEEEKVEREMERQQMSLAGRRMVELARLATRFKSGGDGGGGGEAAAAHVDGLVEVALKALLSGLEKVMKAADCVRLKTLKGVLDVLTPAQKIHFLAATSMLQLQLRQWGKKRESYPDKILTQ